MDDSAKKVTRTKMSSKFVAAKEAHAVPIAWPKSIEATVTMMAGGHQWRLPSRVDVAHWIFGADDDGGKSDLDFLARSSVQQGQEGSSNLLGKNHNV